jgi:hypothetical protein
VLKVRFLVIDFNVLDRTYRLYFVHKRPPIHAVNAKAVLVTDSQCKKMALSKAVKVSIL